MDDITKKRFEPAAQHYAAHVGEAIDALSCGSAALPEGLDPDRWAMSRGMKPDGLPWLFMAMFALSRAEAAGLPGSDMVEYVRKVRDLMSLAGVEAAPPTAP